MKMNLCCAGSCLLALALTGAQVGAHAAPIATSAQVESRTRVDASGRVIETGSGLKKNYAALAPAGLRKNASVPYRAATAQDRPLPSKALAATAANGHRAFAGFASLGYCLGCTGLPLYGNGNATEFFASTSMVQSPSSDSSWFPNDFWYALSYDSNTGFFDQRFVSERQPAAIAQLRLLPGRDAAGTRLAVCGVDGSIRFYSARTKALLANETLQFPVSDVSDCAIRDVSASGQREYLLANRSNITIFDRGGDVVGYLPAAASAKQGMAIGQMDDDAALEIAINQYDPFQPNASPVLIYDGATQTLQQQLGIDSLPQANQLAITRIGTERVAELIVSEEWNAVDGFDPVTGARHWQAPTPINIGALAIGRMSAKPVVLIGDSQWGGVHIVDAASGAEESTISNPEYGVDQLAMGRLSGRDGGQQVLWGAGANGSGPKRFLIADVATSQVIARSPDIDRRFTPPALGHLAPGGSRHVVFASATTNDTYNAGSIVVLDAESGRTVAVQDVPFNSYFGEDRALRVGDLDDDGVDEIVVAGSHFYDGAVNVYSLTGDHQIVQRSSTWSPDAPPYPEFTALALGRSGGAPYAVVAFSQYNGTTGFTDAFVVGLDLTTAVEKWRAVLPGDALPAGTYNPAPAAIESMGRDPSGAELFAVLRAAPDFPSDFNQAQQLDVIRVAKNTGKVVASYAGPITSMDVVKGASLSRRIVAGTNTGSILELSFAGHALHLVTSHPVVPTPIYALRACAHGGYWIVSGQRAERVTGNGTVTWQSTDNGYTAPAGLLTDERARGAPRIWASSIWRVDGFQVD